MRGQMQILEGLSPVPLSVIPAGAQRRAGTQGGARRPWVPDRPSGPSGMTRFAGAALALALAPGAARAAVFGVSIANGSASLGNLLITSSPASVRVDAGTGAVSVVSGGAVLLKANGAPAGPAPIQTVTITCTNSSGNCKATYTVSVTVAAVSGQATGVSAINVANLTATAGSVTFSGAAEGPPGQMFTLTSSSASFTVSFAVGATATLVSGSGHSAAWSYNVRISP